MPARIPVEMSGGLDPYSATPDPLPAAAQSPHNTIRPTNTLHPKNGAQACASSRKPRTSRASPKLLTPSGNNRQSLQAPTHHPSSTTPPQVALQSSSATPQRVTSLRPASPPSAIPPLDPAQANNLCKKVCARIWKIDIGRMFDRVVLSDRRGHIDDVLYSHLLDFFYCFLPMVVKAPISDPIVVRSVDLRNHANLLNMFSGTEPIKEERGRHARHPWFSRPKANGDWIATIEQTMWDITDKLPRINIRRGNMAERGSY